MSRSVQISNGTKVETIDGRIRVNGLWIDTKRLTRAKKIECFSYGLCLGLGIALAVYNAMQV